MTQEKDGKDAKKNVAIMKIKNIMETKEGGEEEKMFV